MGCGERLPDQDTQREEERWKEALGTKAKTVSQECLTLEPSRETLLGEAAKGSYSNPMFLLRGETLHLLHQGSRQRLLALTPGV